MAFGRVRAPEMPRLGRNAPHQDAGLLLTGLIGGAKDVGETVCGALDAPLGVVGIKGPHRLVDNVLDYSSGMVQNVITQVTR